MLEIGEGYGLLIVVENSIWSAMARDMIHVVEPKW